MTLHNNLNVENLGGVEIFYHADYTQILKQSEI